MAALCRLCPEGLPDDEADFWEKGFLSLIDEGEGQFLLQAKTCTRTAKATST